MALHALYEMNMVRAGVVGHPTEWEWCGYNEIVGKRKRYKLLSVDELMRRSHQSDNVRVANWYAEWMKSLSAGESVMRCPQWTESIAVGSKLFVEMIGERMTMRSTLDIETDQAGAWSLKEPNNPYNDFSAPKNASNEVFCQFNSTKRLPVLKNPWSDPK
ncbi:MAG: hypothetical protein HC801_12240 [Nitrospira sp.]|nr:hypothetical protein [Nitrospira sp.]